MRCIGIVRTTIALNLKAASYNLKHLVFLKDSSLTPFKTARRYVNAALDNVYWILDHCQSNLRVVLRTPLNIIQ